MTTCSDEALAEKGLSVLQEVQHRIDSGNGGPSSETLDLLERALLDLDRAVELGSECAAAGVATALDLAVLARSGVLDLAPREADLLRQAEHAEEAEELDRAVELARQALAGAQGQGADAVARVLVRCLAARGNRSRRVVELAIAAAMPEHRLLIKRDAERFLNRLGEESSERCNLCDSTARYQHTLLRGRVANLCEDHSRKLQSILDSVPVLPEPVLRELSAAIADFEAASVLDPQSEPVGQALEQVRELRSRIKRSPVLAPRAKPGRFSRWPWGKALFWALAVLVLFLVERRFAVLIGLAELLLAGALIWRWRQRVRSRELLRRWQRFLPELTWSDAGGVTFEDLCPYDIPWLAAVRLASSGVDPEPLTDPQRREKLLQMEEEILEYYVGSNPYAERQIYDRIVQRAIEHVTAGPGTSRAILRGAAEGTLSMPCTELRSTRARDTEVFWCQQVAASLGQALSHPDQLPDLEPAVRNVLSRPDHLPSVLAAREQIGELAGSLGLSQGEVYRAVARASRGRLSKSLEQVEAFFEKERPFLDRQLRWGTAQGSAEVAAAVWPAIWIAAAENELTLSQMLVLSGAFGCSLERLGLKEIETRLLAAEAPGSGVGPDLEDAVRWSEWQFASSRALWAVLVPIYKNFQSTMRGLEMSPQGGERDGLFSLSFVHRTWNAERPVYARQMGAGTVLIRETVNVFRSYVPSPTEDQYVALLLPSSGKGPPVAAWKLPAGEGFDLERPSLKVRMAGFKMLLHLSLEGTFQEDGLPAGSRWARIAQDRIDGSVQHVETAGTTFIA